MDDVVFQIKKVIKAVLECGFGSTLYHISVPNHWQLTITSFFFYFFGKLSEHFKKKKAPLIYFYL